MKIKIHSLSSTITNSSTTVYCYASESGAQMIKDIVNQVLADGGSTKTFDDLYDIRTKYDDDVYERLYYGHYEETEYLNWPERINWAKQYVIDNNVDILEEFEDGDYSTYYVITSKNGNKNVLDEINKLFSYDAVHDG